MPPQLVSPQTPAAVLVNPEAGGGRGGEMVRAVEEYFATQAFPVEVIRTASPEDLASRVRGAIEKGLQIGRAHV